MVVSPALQRGDWEREKVASPVGAMQTGRTKRSNAFHAIALGPHSPETTAFNIQC